MKRIAPFVWSLSIFMAIIHSKQDCVVEHILYVLKRKYESVLMLISNGPYFKCTTNCTFMYEAIYVVCMHKINVSLPECDDCLLCILSLSINGDILCCIFVDTIEDYKATSQSPHCII